MEKITIRRGKVVRQTAIPAIKHNPAGRNEPCPCGSGKKFKNCCRGKKPRAIPIAGPTTPVTSRS